MQGSSSWGRGGLTLTQKRWAADGNEASTQTWKTGLTMTLGAIGSRAELLAPAENGGFGLALKGDAFFVRIDSNVVSVESVGSRAAAVGEASRMRLALEGSRAVVLAGGFTLTQTTEVGLRHDGGDAESGAGLEVGGGLVYSDPSSGLTMELRARMLAAHAESGYEEWGVSGALRLAPGAPGRGISLSLSPAFGAEAGRSDRVWAARGAAKLVPGADVEPAARLDAEVGYGHPVHGERFTGTLYAGFGYSAAERTYRLGWRLTRPADSGAFRFSLEASRREPANDNRPPEHSIGFRLDARW